MNEQILGSSSTTRIRAEEATVTRPFSAQSIATFRTLLAFNLLAPSPSRRSVSFCDENGTGG
jgi:hypothetical protein